MKNALRKLGKCLPCLGRDSGGHLVLSISFYHSRQPINGSLLNFSVKILEE